MAAGKKYTQFGCILLLFLYAADLAPQSHIQMFTTGLKARSHEDMRAGDGPKDQEPQAKMAQRATNMERRFTWNKMAQGATPTPTRHKHCGPEWPFQLLFFCGFLIQ